MESTEPVVGVGFTSDELDLIRHALEGLIDKVHEWQRRKTVRILLKGNPHRSLGDQRLFELRSLVQRLNEAKQELETLNQKETING